ncbi:hypothetical protein B0H19DRAFT_1256395 [Mycena capillaripes]|nr:hypothetical protein B0H19DRAFT_1256395 [Mycena capillaripes]
MKFSTTLFNVLAAAVLLSTTTDAKFVIGRGASDIVSVQFDQNKDLNYCNKEFVVCGKKVTLGGGGRCGSSAYPKGNNDYYAQVLVNGQDVGRCVYDDTFEKTAVGAVYYQHIDSLVYCHTDAVC